MTENPELKCSNCNKNITETGILECIADAYIEVPITFNSESKEIRAHPVEILDFNEQWIKCRHCGKSLEIPNPNDKDELLTTAMEILEYLKKVDETWRLKRTY